MYTEFGEKLPYLIQQLKNNVEKLHIILIFYQISGINIAKAKNSKKFKKISQTVYLKKKGHKLLETINWHHWFYNVLEV